ncbi:MAG: apolipoprotein N-acyltransferase [Bacteroidota bacterium]
MTSAIDLKRLPDTSLRHRLALAILSGAMLGFAFPPSPFYSLAYVGLVPFFLLVEMLEGTWRILRYSYLVMLIFHCITVYWAGGFTHSNDPWMMSAGGALLLVHPLFYWLPILLFVLVRRRLGSFAGLLAFPFLWIAYEYSHSLSEFSFPWITLGNSQAYDLHRIQIAEYTSVYGLSFIIIAFNVLAFVLVINLATGKWRFRAPEAVIVFCTLILVYVGPWLVGELLHIRHKNQPAGRTLKVGVVQPNIDPWEKWGQGYASKLDSYRLQLATYVRESKALSSRTPDLIVWPETAIPLRILLPQNYSYLSSLRAELDAIGIPVFTGLPYTRYYDSASAPVTANRIESSNVYYEDFNSATLLVPQQPVGPIYKKMVLVPYAERIPYAETFRFLIEPLKWNVGIGSWGKGEDTVVFSLPLRAGEAVKFAAMICYESVYPNFVRLFVGRGAEFLVIITNDSWWGNTSGAYQHASYASFRAIENRRWIIRAANGGISGLVDPAGRIHDETTLYTAATFDGEIQSNSKLTFYARHGDLFAQICLFFGALFVALAFISRPRKSEIA